MSWSIVFRAVPTDIMAFEGPKYTFWLLIFFEADSIFQFPMDSSFADQNL